VSTVLVVLLGMILVVLVVYVVVSYNGLVRRRNEVEEAYRQIDVQLKRRYDLIPNLLEGVKKYFRQEQEVLGEITRARSQAMQPQSPGQQARSEARLSGAIGNLFAVVVVRSRRPTRQKIEPPSRSARASQKGLSGAQV
jgi:LemA protein